MRVENGRGLPCAAVSWRKEPLVLSRLAISHIADHNCDLKPDSDNSTGLAHHLASRSGNIGGPIRLAKEPALRRNVRQMNLAMARRNDDLDRRPPISNGGGKLDAIHTTGHVDIGENDLNVRVDHQHVDSHFVEIGQELDLHDAIFVGHSVSCMIGALASIDAPGMFSKLVMVSPSPRYIDDGDYEGGFSAAQIEELLASMSDNHLGWSASMAPAIMGNPDRPELGEELTNSFCRTDPEIAKHFARATFTSDNRADLAKVRTDTVILQTRDDIIASEKVGKYVNRHIEGSQIVYLDASGHCPNLSAPNAVIAAIDEFI